MANILIVDDVEANRYLLREHVIALEHEPVLAEDGLSALAQMEKHPPDLVLLDVLMPKMNGYEVLDRMKNDNELCNIPVIMITAVDEMESAAQCLEKGAEDYFVKPFNSILLSARIHNSLEKKLLNEKVERYNVHLEDQVLQKTKELSEAYERLSILDHAKSDFLGLISHELRTPLTGLLGATDILMDQDLDEEDLKTTMQIYKDSRKKMLGIIEEAHLITHIDLSGEGFPLKGNPIKNILESAVTIVTEFANSRHVRIGEVPHCNASVLCEKDLLLKAIIALLNTAVKFSQKGAMVELSCDSNENEVFMDIRATGLTIPAKDTHNFFKIFSVATPITPGGDLGLGPPLAERIIKLFHGDTSAENLDPPGVLFKVRLKRICS